MSTCKDCAHCRACHEMWLIAVSSEDDFFERNDAETCEDFINEADFAEVVRCKNCKYFVDANGGYCNFGAGLCVAGKDCYCSYGKRRDV